MKLAYIEHIGEYSKVPYDKYVPRLFEWAKENKVTPGFKNINVFHDDPEEKNAIRMQIMDWNSNK